MNNKLLEEEIKENKVVMLLHSVNEEEGQYKVMNFPPDRNATKIVYLEDYEKINGFEEFGLYRLKR